VLHRAPLEDVNAVFDGLKAGSVDGRTILDMTLAAQPTAVRTRAVVA
jgi:hypothetical protein